RGSLRVSRRVPAVRQIESRDPWGVSRSGEEPSEVQGEVRAALHAAGGHRSCGGGAVRRVEGEVDVWTQIHGRRTHDVHHRCGGEDREDLREGETTGACGGGGGCARDAACGGRTFGLTPRSRFHRRPTPVARAFLFRHWHCCAVLALPMACGVPPRAHEPARTAPVTGVASAAGQCVIAPTVTTGATSTAAPSRDSLMIVIADPADPADPTDPADPAVRAPAPDSQEAGGAPVFDQLATIAPAVDCGDVHAVVLARIWRTDSSDARWRIAAPRHDLAATRPNALRLSPPPGDSAPVLVVQAIPPRVGRDALDAGA